MRRLAPVIQFFRNRFEFDIVFLINVGLLIFLFYVLNSSLFIRLSEKVYRTGLFSDRTIELTIGFFLVALACLIANYLPWKHNWFRDQFSWRALDETGTLRILMVAMSFIIVWAFSTHGYNYYFDQAHHFDRLLLIALLIGVWFSPVVVGPLVVLCYTVSAQMLHPAVINYSYTDKQVVFNILLCFAFFVYMRPITRGKISAFLFVMLCIIGAFYYLPGWKKLDITTSQLFWVVDNDLHNLFISSYLNGWLSFLSLDTALELGKLVEFLRIPLQIVTIIVEVGGITLLLFGRRTTMVLLIGMVMMHTGIFVSSGVFFWKWIMMDLFVALYLWKNADNEQVHKLFKLPYAIISIVIIANGLALFSAIPLGWYDGNVNNFYELEVVDTQGNTFEFPRSWMQPYDLRITQSRVYLLNYAKLRANTYGTTQIDGAYLTLRNEGLAALEDVRETYGNNNYRRDRIKDFEQFLLTYFTNYNKHRQSFFIYNIFPAPLHINTSPRPNAYNGEYPIQLVRVRFFETYYENHQVTFLQDKIVLEVEIPIEESP